MQGVVADDRLQHFAVADGVAISTDPRATSRRLLELLWSRLAVAAPDAHLVSLLREVQASCAQLGRRPHLRGMASTLVGCRIAGAEVTVFNVGDSRAYLLADDRAVLLSRDHSVLNEMVEDGDLTAEQAGEAATFMRGLTSQFVVEADDDAENFQVNIATTLWQPGERLLLCSDGLNEAHSDAQIATGLAAGADVAQLLNLCKQARRAGGTDDFSVVVLSRIGPVPTSVQGIP
ncbi:MAG: protein phosphatase 2C domain-containing protein [Burkholderiaceae bacterium]